MLQKFDQTRGEANEKSPVLAAQIWPILVGHVVRRQTTRYRQLERLIYGHWTSGLATRRALELIAYFCRENGLPEFNVLVVGEDGIPGAGTPIPASGRNWAQEREAAYTVNTVVWYNIIPPTIEEFAAVSLRHPAGNTAVAAE